MTRTASQTHPAHPDPVAPRSRKRLSISLEVLGSSCWPWLSIPLFFFNWLDVYLVFFGETPTVEDSNVTAYRVALGILRRRHGAGAGSPATGGGSRSAARPTGTVSCSSWASPRRWSSTSAIEHSSPEPPPAQESHPVCYGDTGDCPGG